VSGRKCSWRGVAAAVLATCLVVLAAALLERPEPALAEPDALPAPAETEPLSAAEAAQELREAEEILEGARPHQSRELTTELRDVALALPYMRPAQRRRARALLARPPSSCAGCEDLNDATPGDEPFGSGWSPSETKHRQAEEGERFVVHWVDGDPDGRHTSTAQFAQRVAELLERSADVQHGQLGWPPPLSDGVRGGDGRVDVYLANLCDRKSRSRPCIFGFTATETQDPSCRAPGYRCAGYMVLDNDFSEFKRPLRALQATIAHEYNHLLQFALDAAQETWMFESTATWVEEHVFPEADDWLRSYVGFWARGSRQSLTDVSAGRGLRVYGSAVWNHWLTARYGAETVLRAWQSSRKTKPRHWAAGAYDAAIRARGGRGFGAELVRFAAATSEWRAGDLPDRSSFPDVRRSGRIVAGGRGLRLRLNNASYALLRPVAKGARRLTLRVRAPRRTRSGIALVGRAGRPLSGTVVQAVRYLPRGGTATVSLGARRLRRVTAVVVNADARVRGAPPAPRLYLRDSQRYRVRLSAR